MRLMWSSSFLQENHGVKENSDLRSFAIDDAHGYYIKHGNNIDLKDVDWSPDYTSKEILETSGNAAILIRIPFEALYAYRHLTCGSHAGDTTAYQFLGKVLKYVNLLVYLRKSIHL